MADTAKPVVTFEQMMEKLKWAHAAADFVRSIGIPVHEGTPADVAGSFVPHLRVAKGELVVNLDEVYPGDILHEAGHLATIPAQFRHLADGTLRVVFKAMDQYLKDNPQGLGAWPEDPICRGILQCGEAEAAAWQYAAAQEIGMPDVWLFPEGSFQGEAEETLMRLKANAYFGINGLQAANWTRVHAMGNPALPHYPKMAFWLYGGEVLKNAN